MNDHNEGNLHDLKVGRAGGCEVILSQFEIRSVSLDGTL